MTFILKEGMIHIVDNHGLANNNIEGNVETPGLEGYKLEYTINNGEYKPLKENLVIPKEYLKGTQILLTIRAMKGKDIAYFKSDVIPHTHSIIFGKR